MTVFCKDCIHCIPKKQSYVFFGIGKLYSEYERLEYAKCSAALKDSEEYLVAGALSPIDSRYFYCTTVRIGSGKCGPEGKLFQPKSEGIDAV